MASKQYKQLRSWHFVKYRSARSNQLRKFSPRVKLIAEVYSKKSGKRLGVMNTVKEGKVVPRRFSTKAKILYHEGRKAAKTRDRAKLGSSFSINYQSLVADQIEKWGIGELLNGKIRENGKVRFFIKLEGNDNTGLSLSSDGLDTEPHETDYTKPNSRWADIIAALIIEKLRDSQIRTSPKKYSKSNPYWYRGRGIAEYHFIRKYLATCYTLG